MCCRAERSGALSQRAGYGDLGGRTDAHLHARPINHHPHAAKLPRAGMPDRKHSKVQAAANGDFDKALGHNGRG
jgi:hypothetical protein